MTRAEHFAHARELMTARGCLRRATSFPLNPGLAPAWARGQALHAIEVALLSLKESFSFEFSGEVNPYEVTS